MLGGCQVIYLVFFYLDFANLAFSKNFSTKNEVVPSLKNPNCVGFQNFSVMYTWESNPPGCNLVSGLAVL